MYVLVIIRDLCLAPAIAQPSDISAVSRSAFKFLPVSRAGLAFYSLELYRSNLVCYLRLWRLLWARVYD